MGLSQKLSEWLLFGVNWGDALVMCAVTALAAFVVGWRVGDARRKKLWHAVYDMKLHCPNCGQQHLDVDEFKTRVHRKHQCENTPGGRTGCGHRWQPFPYPTRGVE